MDKKNKAQMIRAIQYAKRQLGLDEETYRKNLKFATCGETSLRAMTPQECWKVIQYFKNVLGFKFTFPGDITLADNEQSKLVRHMWLKLKNYGVLRNPSEKALAAYVKRITKVDRLEWLKTDQAQHLIETLKNWVDRIEDKIISEALQTGALRLPVGFNNYADFLKALHSKQIDVSLYDAISTFKAEAKNYLNSYHSVRRLACGGEGG